MNIHEFINNLGEVFEETDLSTLTPETKFRELDEWSSLSGLNLIAFADEEFDKEISPAELKKAITIQDLFDLLTK